jgi:transcriptional regulator with XRE-family HTH domain
MKNRIQKALSDRVTKNVRRLLAKKNLKQEDISRRSDLDKGNLSRYLSGQRDYTFLGLQRISEALKVDIGELFKKH